MLLYRTFPWLASAPAGEPGHGVYVPEPSGAGRVDNPAHYRALYLSNAPAGAVAETFGSLKLWTPRMFRRPDLPGGVRALATYDLADTLPIFDLDDPDALKALDIRPSQVVTRDRAVTQPWALAVFQQQRWSGVRWWSYYEPRWYSYAVWNIGALRLVEGTVRAMTPSNPAVIEASDVLRRPRRSR